MLRGWLRRILHEPLVLFLVLGGLIFAANSLLHPPQATDDRRIAVTGDDIARISALYTQQWGAPPKAAELPDLVDNYIRSEVLFREGTALGLGSDDAILRNRVVQKMEFLLQDSANIAQPSDAEIVEYFRTHEAAYRVPEQRLFTQIYFSPSLRGDHRAETDARAALTAINNGKAADAGDPFMLGDDAATPRSRDAVERDFGTAFAAALFDLPPGAWQGPLRSTFGLHLVQVTQRIPPHTPALSEIRNRVHDDLMGERLRQATEAAYARIRAHYQVEISPGTAPAVR